MIKKDIAYGINPTTGNDVILTEKTAVVDEPKKELSEIDLIFQNADNDMLEQKQKYLKIKTKKTKKKRKRIFLKYVLPVLVLLAILIGVCIYYGIEVLNTAIPTVKTELTESLITARRELEAVDDSTLTIDEYYQKQVLLLLSEDEIRNAINNLSDLELLTSSGSLGIDDIIPPEKQEKYRQIEAEYEKAKAEELAQATKPTEDNTQSTESNISK